MTSIETGQTPDIAIDAPVARVNGTASHDEPPAEGSAPLRRRRLGDVAALVVLAAVVLASFRGAFLAGLVPYEADTLRFYYPLERWFAEEFKSGHIPLWNPLIFAGYPIFGDGELGFAYPLHLLLLTLLPGDQTYVWMRISTPLVAAVGMYGLCRALRLGHLPALIGGITFSLGSFLPAQAHHEDMTRSVAWTPLALACSEWGLQTTGRTRWLRLTGAAAAVAMSGLGLHPQGLAMSLMATASFIIVRVLAAAAPSDQQAGPFLRRVVRRVPLLIEVGFYVVGLGLALAAVQLVPVGERGLATFRASQPDYVFATSYAFPPLNLVDLIFPYFYRAPDSTYWSLWSPWETTLYVGMVPLGLGVVGIVRAWRTLAAYFATLALGGLWLAFASYVPFDLYRLLWSLPGFSAFRVPGRYTFLFVLGWAVLAAYGAHVLDSHVDITRRRVLAAVTATALAIGLTAGLAFGIEMLRAQIEIHRLGALEIIRDFYLTMRHHQEGLPGEAVFRGLVHSLDLTTARTALSLLFLGMAGVALAAALLRGSFGRGFQAVLAVLAAADLLVFTSGLHYELPVQDLAARAPAAEFLASHAGGGRIFVPFPTPAVEANRLVPFRVEDVGGYSSLESRLNFSYWTQLTGTHNQLMELANVRYLVYPTKRSTQPSFEQVPFDPQKPLLIGSRGSVGGSDSWSFGGHRTTQVRVIGALTHAFTIPQDAIVAEVRLIPRSGEPVVIELRAGVDLAEWAYDRPDAVGKITHERPRTIAFRRPDFDPVFNTTYPLYLWFSYHDLTQPVEVERAEVRYVYPKGSMELYGLGLFDGISRDLEFATQQNRTKFNLAYQDSGVEIYESQTTQPRAFVVPRAVAPDGDMEGVGSLVYTPFDPQTAVVLEGPEASVWLQDPGSGPAGARAPGLTTLMGEWSDGATYRVASPTGGFLFRSVTYTPEWRAWVDGREQPVLRANYLFQAVPVPVGTHTIELRYDPRPVRLGLLISVGAALVALGVVIVASVSTLRSRRRASRESRTQAADESPSLD